MNQPMLVLFMLVLFATARTTVVKAIILFCILTLLLGGSARAQPCQYDNMTIPGTTTPIVYPPAQPYLMEVTSDQLMQDAKRSSVPMIILYYKPGDKASAQQEVNIQDAGRNWLTNVRYYRVDVTKDTDPCSQPGQTPCVVFVQPDKNGYPALLQASSVYMDRKATFDFMSRGMQMVKSQPFVARPVGNVGYVYASDIAHDVHRYDCPAVVLYYNSDSFLSLLAEQIFGEASLKYGQRAMFFKIDTAQDIQDGDKVGKLPSVVIYTKDGDDGAQRVKSTYRDGFRDMKRTEDFLNTLPPAWRLTP